MRVLALKRVGAGPGHAGVTLKGCAVITLIQKRSRTRFSGPWATVARGPSGEQRRYRTRRSNHECKDGFRMDDTPRAFRGVW